MGVTFTPDQQGVLTREERIFLSLRQQAPVRQQSL